MGGINGKTTRDKFTRPKTKEEKESALNALFDEEKGDEKGGNGKAFDSEETAGQEPEPPKTGGNKLSGNKAASAASKKKVELSQSENGNSGYDINALIENDIEEDGWVTRNFKMRRSTMTKIKTLTNRANAMKMRRTQDDILNDILDDWFKNKKM